MPHEHYRRSCTLVPTGGICDPGGRWGVKFRGSPAWAGTVTIGAGLGITELVAGVLTLRASPVAALGETVIAWTPGTIAHRIISVVGHADKPLAVSAVAVVILALGALIGSLWVRSRVAAIAVLAGLAAAAMAMVMSRPNTSILTGLLCLAGAAVTLVVLDALTGERSGVAAGVEAAASRRRFRGA